METEESQMTHDWKDVAREFYWEGEGLQIRALAEEIARLREENQRKHERVMGLGSQLTQSEAARLELRNKLKEEIINDENCTAVEEALKADSQTPNRLLEALKFIEVRLEHTLVKNKCECDLEYGTCSGHVALARLREVIGEGEK